MDEQTLAIAFYGGLLALILVVWRNRIERNGILFMKRTEEYVPLIAAFGESHARALHVLGTLGVACGLVAMVGTSALMVHGAWTIFSSPSARPAATVGIVVPGIRVPGSPVYIPLIEGIVAIATVIIVHEFAHGVLAASHGVRPKSIWLFLLLVIPGAGVELDETRIMRKGLRARLHIYAAGAFANLLCAIAALAFLNHGLVPAYEAVTVPVGIEVTETVPGLPAALAGVGNGTVIQGVNGSQVTGYASFLEALEGVGPNATVALATDRGEYTLTAAPHPEDPSRGYLGVVIDSTGVRRAREGWGPFGGERLGDALSRGMGMAYYMFMLQLSIGLINLLPVFPLDGGRMLIDLAGEYGGVSGALVAKAISTALLFVFIINFIGPQSVSLTARLLG